MDAVSTQYKVRTCFECLGDAEYFCTTNGSDICTQCYKEIGNGNDGFRTKDHELILNCKKLNIRQFPEICMRHSENVYENYCEHCELPFCSQCTEHRTHNQTDLKKAYDTKIHQNENNKLEKMLQKCILSIQPSILVEIEYHKCNRDQIPSNILTKAQRLKQHLAIIWQDFKIRHSCLKQKIRQKSILVRIQRYEHTLEQSAIRPVQFLLLKNKMSFPKAQFAPHTSKLYMTESLKKKNVLEAFQETIRTEKREGLDLKRFKNIDKPTLKFLENSKLFMHLLEVISPDINSRDQFTDRSEFG